MIERMMRLFSTGVDPPHERITAEVDAHAKAFKLRTGMRPRTCYHLVLVSLSLKIIGATWLSMVGLEYVRYYVINDINSLTMVATMTESPLGLLKAFIFPYSGVIADRVSRKQLIVLASVSSCLGAWLMCLCPSVSVLVVSRSLGLVADMSGPIRDAMLRDIFSTAEWEHLRGGVTGIKSYMAILGSTVTALAVGVGMGLLSLGDLGMIGLGNEYSQRKDECRGQQHCVTPGQYSWDGDEWQVDGLLRVVMLMGAAALTLEAMLVFIFLPETLSREGHEQTSVCKFIKHSLRDVGAPWNNVRVLATRQLRDLSLIRALYCTILSGGSTLFMSWYRRHELDTLTMYRLGAAGGTVGFLVLLAIVPLVDRFGDLRGIWLPAKVLAILYGISVALIPASHWYLSFITFPLFGGPSATFSRFTKDLLAKLVPPDVQATFQTAQAFIFDIQRCIFAWPWLGLLICSENLPYPLDVLPIWVALVLGTVTLLLVSRQLPTDPHKDIQESRALDAYWDTSYVKSGWYERHGGNLSKASFQNKGQDDIVEAKSKVQEAEVQFSAIVGSTAEVVEVVVDNTMVVEEVVIDDHCQAVSTACDSRMSL